MVPFVQVSRQLIVYLPNHEEVVLMAKVFKCSDLGMKCDFVARAETEEELMKLVRKHGMEAHGMADVKPELLAKVKAAIRDE
jgi:predicted small metal-binding protein